MNHQMSSFEVNPPQKYPPGGFLRVLLSGVPLYFVVIDRTYYRRFQAEIYACTDIYHQPNLFLMHNIFITSIVITIILGHLLNILNKYQTGVGNVQKCSGTICYTQHFRFTISDLLKILGGIGWQIHRCDHTICSIISSLKLTNFIGGLCFLYG